MLAKVLCGATVGLDGVMIQVEVDVADRGFPSFTVVGLPSKAIDEAKERVRTALVNSSFEMPDSRITVNLAPADIPKVGSGYDVPIALGILACTGVLNQSQINNGVFIGELSLEGNIRRVPGVISIAFMAQELKIKTLFVPIENAQEASLARNIEIVPVKNLRELVDHIIGVTFIKSYSDIEQIHSNIDSTFDFDMNEIKGQQNAKRALEIAAAGFHNIHFTGPPGAGKTMLSRALPSILPTLDDDEFLEVTKIYSVAGLLHKSVIQTRRPFRAPHTTMSRVGLIGGGSFPMPGEISLAHRGVLFLDEFSEFPNHVIEAMRQPLEDGCITISRAAGSLSFPARFMLVAASNPCPCGYLGHPKRRCTCQQGVIARYKKRISGPIADRIDLHVDVPAVDEFTLTQESHGESSICIAERINKARSIQKLRFKDTSLKSNSAMKTENIRQFCILGEHEKQLMQQAITSLSLSARAYFKAIKIARTIADLSGDQYINSCHITEALQYRYKNSG